MAERQINIKEQIKKAVDYLKQKVEIKEVIFFGSQLSGKADKYSDIDLAVISPEFSGKSYEEILNVFAELAVKFGSRVEMHPYTEEDVRNARPTNFIGYLLKHGKVVFSDEKFLI